MRNLLLFLAKYGHLLLFLILEIICFSLIIQFNDSQKETWVNSVNLYTGRVQERVNGVNNYLKLQQLNDSLSVENAKLLQQIIDFKVDLKDNAYQNFESIDTSIHTIIPTRVCDKTIRLRNNYFTLCKGSKQGIKKGMGVVSKQGIVGVVKSVTDHYSDVILLLHSQSRTSVSIKGKQYFGNLVWRTNDHSLMKMEAVPKYANVSLADTVITSGYSTIFPQGLEVGKVESINDEQGGNNYEIDVRLFNNIELLEYVYVIGIDHGLEVQELYSKKNSN